MAVTPLQGLTVPAATDAPNGPVQITALGTSLERKLVQVYTNAAARTAAYTLAGLTPTAGDTSYLTGTKRHEVYDGANWAPLAGTAVGYHKRTSNVTFVGTELGVIRVGATMLSGYKYLILTSPLRISTVSGETGKVNLRYTTTGSAGTSDVVLDSVEGNGSSAFAPAQSPVLAVTFAPGANVTFSCALTLLRSGGSGNVTLVGSTIQPIELSIIVMGVDPGDTGVDL